MNDLSVIDRFLETFVTYIDSGFGLLQGDVAFLTAILIGIDITLAGLFWAFDAQGNVMGKLVKKILYVGVFAFIITNFAVLADIIFRSFAGLGINVTNNTLTPQDLMRPGRIAGIGFDAAWPLLNQAGSMLGFTVFFDNIVTVLVLMFAWVIVILAFFILAVQLFITILEFKLTTLAGFVLVPFALWNKTSFLAERVLGNVISTGIKVMVLAVIVGIGASFFSDFTTALNGREPDLGQAMSLVLAAISLFALGIFGPAIASGLVTGAPQLGAGAAIGTVGGIAAGTALAGGAVAGSARLMGAGARGGWSALQAGTAMSSSASTAYRMGQATSGQSGMAGAGAGMAGVVHAGIGAVGQRFASAARSARQSFSESATRGVQAGWKATGGEPPKSTASPSAASSSSADPAPQWARNIASDRAAHTQRHIAAQAIKDGDKGGAAANPDLSEEK